MKIRTLSLFATLAFLFLFSTLAQAQYAQEIEPGSFNGIEVSGGYTVKLKQGNVNMVRLSGAKTDKEKTVVEVINDVLTIDSKKGGPKKPNIEITFTSVEFLYFHDGVSVKGLNEIKGTELSFNLSDGSSGSLEMDCEVCDLNIQEGSTVKVKLGNAEKVQAYISEGAVCEITDGSTGNFQIQVSEGGILNSFDFSANEVLANVFEGGIVKVDATSELKVSAREGGMLTYKDHAGLDVSKETHEGGMVMKQ